MIIDHLDGLKKYTCVCIDKAERTHDEISDEHKFYMTLKRKGVMANSIYPINSSNIRYMQKNGQTINY